MDSGVLRIRPPPPRRCSFVLSPSIWCRWSGRSGRVGLRQDTLFIAGRNLWQEIAWAGLVKLSFRGIDSSCLGVVCRLLVHLSEESCGSSAVMRRLSRLPASDLVRIGCQVRRNAVCRVGRHLAPDQFFATDLQSGTWKICDLAEAARRPPASHNCEYQTPLHGYAVRCSLLRRQPTATPPSPRNVQRRTRLVGSGTVAATGGGLKLLRLAARVLKPFTDWPPGVSNSRAVPSKLSVRLPAAGVV